MTNYRKKPVVIQAVQWDGTYLHAKQLEADLGLTSLGMTAHPNNNSVSWWKIATLEDGHVISAMDWIITGVKGEHYPCKPDIFELTYEAAIAQPVQPATPDGMCLVPIEATPQMIAAGEVYTHTYYSGQDDLLQAYRAMIAVHNTLPHTALPAEPAPLRPLTAAQMKSTSESVWGVNNDQTISEAWRDAAAAQTVQPADHVADVSKLVSEFVIADLAMMHLGSYAEKDYDFAMAVMKAYQQASATSAPERDKLLQIIAAAYQIAGAHDAPEHVLDVLANPEMATQEQIDALLPYVPVQPTSQIPKPPGHPEPWTFTWSKLELNAMVDYGKECFEAGQAQPKETK